MLESVRRQLSSGILLNRSRRHGTVHPPTAEQGAPQGSACFNSKLSHFVNQRGARQSEPIGRSVLSSDQPVSLLQYFQDVLPAGVGKRA